MIKSLDHRHARLIAVGLATALFGAYGCNSNKDEGSASVHKDDPAWCESVKPGTITSVNTMCVVMPGHPVDPAVKPVEFQGQKIGFCCEHCIAKWQAMSDPAKQDALQKALVSARNQGKGVQ